MHFDLIGVADPMSPRDERDPAKARRAIESCPMADRTSSAVSANEQRCFHLVRALRASNRQFPALIETSDRRQPMPSPKLPRLCRAILQNAIKTFTPNAQPMIAKRCKVQHRYERSSPPTERSMQRHRG